MFCFGILTDLLLASVVVIAHTHTDTIFATSLFRATDLHAFIFVLKFHMVFGIFVKKKSHLTMDTWSCLGWKGVIRHREYILIE